MVLLDPTSLARLLISFLCREFYGALPTREVQQKNQKMGLVVYICSCAFKRYKRYKPYFVRTYHGKESHHNNPMSSVMSRSVTPVCVLHQLALATSLVHHLDLF